MRVDPHFSHVTQCPDDRLDIFFGSLAAAEKDDLFVQWYFVMLEHFLPCTCRFQKIVINNPVSQRKNWFLDTIFQDEFLLGKRGHVSNVIPVVNKSFIFPRIKTKCLANDRKIAASVIL